MGAISLLDSLSRFWSSLLKRPEAKQSLAEAISRGLLPGKFSSPARDRTSADLCRLVYSPGRLLPDRSRPFPSPAEWMGFLQPTRYLRRWGVYLKLGIPRAGSGLPWLVYVGSATGIGGFIQRFLSHLSGMIRGK